MKSTDAISALSALAHEGRLAVFRLLMRRAPAETAAGEIAAALDIAAPTLSNQLAQLERAGLIRARRAGRQMLYAADLEQAGALIGFLAAECCRGRPEICAPAAAPFLARPAGPRRRVLFLCRENAARSILAEAILRRRAPERFEVASAGAAPRGEIHPRVAALLESWSLDPSTFRSTSWDDFATPDAPPFDLVVTLCDAAADAEQPAWPGQPVFVHWSQPDPSRAPANDDAPDPFAAAAATLEARLSALADLNLDAMDRAEAQARLDAIADIAPERA